MIGLTDLRDLDELDVALVKIIFEELKADALRCWVVGHDGKNSSLQERITLPPSASGRVADYEVRDEQAQPVLQYCLQQKKTGDIIESDGRVRYILPVTNGRQVTSILEVWRSSVLSADELDVTQSLLKACCNHAQILAQSDHDELTGLLNRRRFTTSFNQTLSRLAAGSVLARRRNGPGKHAHVAVVDIDFFKKVNDGFGHPYGDEVLVLVARLMKACFRGEDLVFRFGGEEFVLILQDTDPTEAEVALERLRSSVEAFHFPQVGRITVSIGFTAVRLGDNGQDTFGRADKALYVAKHSGRNQVRSYERLVATGSIVESAEESQEVELF